MEPPLPFLLLPIGLPPCLRGVDPARTDGTIHLTVGEEADRPFSDVSSRPSPSSALAALDHDDDFFLSAI